MKNIAFITGASGEIGKSISKNLIDSGYDLILIGRDQKKLDMFVSEDLESEHRPDVETYSCDVSQPAQVRALMETIHQRNLKISVLVNAAGISGGGVTAEIGDELWLSVIATNLNGTFFVTREALRLGLIRKGGADHQYRLDRREAGRPPRLALLRVEARDGRLHQGA